MDTTYTSNEVDLFGGIAGVRLATPEFHLDEQVILRNTYAHVMAPYIMAFRRPTSNGPHPGPWKAASGGLGFDVEVEIAIPKDHQPTGFDRLNTIWWIAALLRLHQPVLLRVPVISNMAFGSIADSTKEPAFWPVEMSPRQVAFAGNPKRHLPLDCLLWVKDCWVSGAALMDTPAFNAAFRALDEALWCSSLATSLLMLWSSMEALIRPGGRDIGRTLAQAIAAYLEPPGSTRDRLFTKVRDLYVHRGMTAHAAQPAEGNPTAETYHVARRCFMKALESASLPDCKALLEQWKTVT